MQQTTLGLDERIERMLTYSLGWITGFFFFFAEKNPTVRWHALQSIVTFGTLSLLFVGAYMLRAMLSWIPLLGLLTDFGLGLLANIICWTMIILWVWLMVMASSRPMYRLPYIGSVVHAFLSV